MHVPSRIIYCCCADPDTGAPHPFTAAFWLASRGHRVTIICAGSPQQTSVTSPLCSVPTTRISGGTIEFELKLLSKLIRWRNREPDSIFYIHGHLCTAPALLALSGVRCSSVIYHSQDFLEPGKHPQWEFWERRFARRAGQIICNEINRARFMQAHYHLGALPHTVPTALPSVWPRPEQNQELRASILARINRGSNQPTCLIMHEGSFGAVRCGPNILQALALLPKEFALVFSGITADSASARNLKAAATSLGIADRILALPHLPFEDLLRHTACCDVGLLLYPNDGIGNFYQCPGRLTHYVGCGLPVVASNFPGLQQLICKYDLGGVCDPESPEAIAASIRDIWAIPAKQALFRQKRARRLALQELAYDNKASLIEAAVGKASAQVRI